MNREEENRKIEDQTKPSIKKCHPFIYINYDRTGIIPAEDINIIKKTAEFYVLSTLDNQDETDDNGNDFLSKLKAELGEEKQFQFLNEQHPLNLVFKNIVCQYRDVLADHEIIRDQNIYLRHCFERATYNEYKTQVERNNQESFNLYKIRFAAINWNKFHIVSSVENMLKLQDVDKGNNDTNEVQNKELSLENIEYSAPLDFSQLSERKIARNETIEFLNKYFEGSKEDVKSGKSSSSIQNKQIDTKRSKKRKGKMLIKGQGETRIHKKKK